MTKHYDDNRLKRLLKRLLSFLAPCGELALGGFSVKNPSRNHMEVLGNWTLHHWNERQLAQLAESFGAYNYAVHSAGVNLFLHIKN
jgi:hypothetical protein